jgi:hypothetical protein
VALKGVVNFHATIKGNGLTFPSFEFNPIESSVDRVEIEAPNGNDILARAHFSAAVSKAEARTRAAAAITTALSRIAFIHNLIIEPAQMTSEQFTSVGLPPGVVEVESGDYVIVGGEARMVLGVPAATVKSELEQGALPGEHNYGLLRSAVLAASPVEAFMLLYNLLLMLCNDLQDDVDAFIVSEDPAVPRTPSPRRACTMETVYTK